MIENEEEITVEGGHDEHVQELKARREDLRRRVDEKNRIQENRNVRMSLLFHCLFFVEAFIAAEYCYCFNIKFQLFIAYRL